MYKNKMSTINIFIKSAIKVASKTYALKITSDYTVFDVKKEIEGIDNVSAEWIRLWHSRKNQFLDNDRSNVQEVGIRENDTLWAEFRYKLDEKPHY